MAVQRPRRVGKSCELGGPNGFRNHALLNASAALFQLSCQPSGERSQTITTKTKRLIAAAVLLNGVLLDLDGKARA